MHILSAIITASFLIKVLADGGHSQILTDAVWYGSTLFFTAIGVWWNNRKNKKLVYRVKESEEKADVACVVAKDAGERAATATNKVEELEGRAADLEGKAGQAMRTAENVAATTAGRRAEIDEDLLKLKREINELQRLYLAMTQDRDAIRIERDAMRIKHLEAVAMVEKLAKQNEDLFETNNQLREQLAQVRHELDLVKVTQDTLRGLP